MLLPPPPQLLPRLHQFLDGAGRREITSCDPATVVRPLVEVAHSARAQQRQASAKRIQILPTQYFFLPVDVGSAGHDGEFYHANKRRICELSIRKVDNEYVHRNEVPILAIVTGGLERIELPPLRRPDVPDDDPDEALVLWGVRYYSYCLIAHIRDVLRGMMELLRLGNGATAFFPARHAFEWTAHTCLMSRELKPLIANSDWKSARELQSRVMQSNRWVKDYGRNYVADDARAPYDQMPEGMRVKNALKAYEKWQEETTGTSDSKDSYALLSEHTHPNSACFTRYTEFYGPEVRFVRPSDDASILGEERCLLHFLLFLDELLRLGRDTKVRGQVSTVIDEILSAFNNNCE